MDSQATHSGHLVLFCVPAWSHLRPLCALSAKLVQERTDVAVTLLIGGQPGSLKQTEQEISRYFLLSEADSRAKTNIRIVNICPQMVDIVTLSRMIPQEFQGYYDKLVNCQPVQCLETDGTFDAVRKPTAVVLDYFFLPALQYIRSVTAKSVPVFAWVTTSASFALRTMGPEKLGGTGDLVSKARTQAEATGRKFEDVIDELLNPSAGNVVNLPGVPPMYDYEWFPQERTQETPQYLLNATSYIFSRECDGFVSASCAAFEPESLEAIRTWLGETNRPVYAVGPLVPPVSRDAGLSDIAKQMEMDSTKNGEEFQTFLDKTLTSHGERSLLYFAFGTLWWPTRNEYVWAVVDVLLQLRFPFILAHASPRAVTPPGYAEKIKKSGIGLLSPWCPQQTILNHPVTGWFLTHCGQNSVTEALVHGIPIIAWPLKADQPLNAANLTLNLDIAFEIIEGRAGFGLKPLYRGVQPKGTVEAVRDEARITLQRARGPEGERKRRNVESMRDKWMDEWEEGGEALINLRKFLNDACPDGFQRF